MGKVLQNRDGAVFGLSCSADIYKKLLFESERLSKDWNEYDAFNFLVKAWHLFHDWPKSDPQRALSRNKRNKNKLPREMVLGSN